MTTTQHYRYSICGHPVDPVLKDFAHSTLSHIRFCDTYSGNAAADHDTEFEVVGVEAEQIHGLCPLCLQQRLSSGQSDLAVAAQIFRSKTVPHEDNCEEDGCRRLFVIRKTPSIPMQSTSISGSQPSADVTRAKSKNSTWSALFDERDDQASDNLGQSGTMIFREHQEEAPNHDFPQPTLGDRFPRKLYVPQKKKKSSQLVAAHRDDNLDDAGEQVLEMVDNVDAGTALPRQCQ